MFDDDPTPVRHVDLLAVEQARAEGMRRERTRWYCEVDRMVLLLRHMSDDSSDPQNQLFAARMFEQFAMHMRSR
jgi:hypothetical protein